MRIAEPTHAEGTIETIGEKYRVVQVLGVGGMGTVYEAENQWTGRRVAIKLLRPELTATPNIVRRFTQEAQAAAKIRHDHIVDVLDMGRDPSTGSFFIVQELLEGEDLGAWLHTHRRMTPREAFEVLIPVMGALAAAHDEGIVHRDIKPENIYLARSKSGAITPKLIDFGISKLSDANGPVKMTHTGMAIGTPEYMSPEQARGDETLDARTDIWSLGVVLYEIISGGVPYQAKNYNLVVSRVISEPVPPITTHVPELHPSIAAIIDRALARDCDDRYPTVRAMLRDVLACDELGLGDAANVAARFGAGIHDPDRATDAPREPDSLSTPAIASTLDGVEPTDRPSLPPTALNTRPRLGAFGAAALLAAGVFFAATMPRRSHEIARPIRASLAGLAAHVNRPAPPPNADASPAMAVRPASPPVVASTAAPRAANPMPARRPVNVAFESHVLTRANALSYAPMPRTQPSMAEPSPVIPMRSSAPTSVVHRHHIVVE